MPGGPSKKKKKKKERKKEEKTNNNKTITKQQNRLSWIQNEEHFIFLFLPLFCLKMRCFPLKDDLPKYKKIYVKLQYDIFIFFFYFIFLCDKRTQTVHHTLPPPPPPFALIYHWRELPQVSFFVATQFCGYKHVFVATEHVVCRDKNDTCGSSRQ